MARAVRRAEVAEVAVGGVAVAAFGLGHQRPDAGMRVLAAVLAHPGRIGLDVAGARLRRRRGADRAGGAGRPRGRPGALRARPSPDAGAPRVPPGEHRPGLGDQVDAALFVGGRAERRAVVEEGAPVPLAVPAGALERATPAARGVAPGRGARDVAAALGQRREAFDDVDQEPGEPDRFAPAFVADPVHAVVPVARAHQRQAVRADGQAVVDRPGAVLVDAGQFGAPVRHVIRVLGARRHRHAFEERHALVEHARHRPWSRCSAARHAAARAGRRRNGCARRRRWARATSAARRLRETGATRQAGAGGEACRARPRRAPSRPAAGRGSRRRRRPDRSRPWPRAGRRPSGREASD